MKYRTIVADPPWPVKDSGPRTFPGHPSGNWAPESAGTVSVVPYQRMSIVAIESLPVGDMAMADCHLYLWAVNAYLEAAYKVARTWGFRPSTLLTWEKPPRGIGFGGTFVNTTEFVLFCRRGSLAAAQRVDTTWFQWPRGPHSAKPEAFLDLVEQVSPGPYLELFARRNRLGWDTWGNECLDHTAALSMWEARS